MGDVTLAGRGLLPSSLTPTVPNEYDDALDRMERESGLEAVDGMNKFDRCRRLLACDDPPLGDDDELCRDLLGEFGKK